MKKWNKGMRLGLLTVLLCLILAATASAATVASGTCGADGDNLTWNLSEDGTLTISGSGKMTNYSEGGAPWYKHRLKIEKVVIEEGVTSIGIYAFWSCGKLTEITIPEGITSIGSYAFENCISLTEITIPEGITAIGSFAFRGCGSLTAIAIPEGVISIGISAFYDCSSLTEITIPKGVSSIGDLAFCGCSSLTTITIPDGVTTIGTATFSACSSLTAITIPDGVTTIGGVAFSGCISLIEITIPDSVSSIGAYAFRSCSSLTEITIPNTVESIGDYAFQSCTSLAEITFEGDAPAIETSAFNIVTATCYYPGDNETWTEEVRQNYDGTLTWKPYYTGTCGENLTWELAEDGTLTISGTGEMDNYQSDEQPWYDYKSSIKSVVIADGVSSIGDLAFAFCSNLTEIVIPEGVTSIGDAAFAFCSGLTEITIPEGVTTIGGNTFYSCSSLTSVTIPEGISSIDYCAFYGCSSLTTIIIPEGVASIGHYAFYGCSSLTSIDIPESVSSIYGQAFWGCSSLTKITIPDGVTSIGANAFCSCISLTEITIPDSVSSIGAYAFRSCISLTTVTIPEGVISIGSSAFNGCSSLCEIVFAGNAPAFGETNVFGGVTATCYYPANNATWTDEVRQNYGGKLTWVPSVPMITTQPSDVSAIVGEKVTFSVSATGATSYQWQYKTPTGVWTNSPATGNKTATLTVPATLARNGYQYRCKVTNAAGSVTTNAATLTVASKPVITSQPVSKTVGAADAVSFTVVATGEGLKYQWQYKTPAGVWTNNTCTTATFSLTKAENFRNGYQYRCKVTNAGGTVYSNVATLTVASKPVIATQPKSITAKVGDTVTFTVSATGATSYQWQYKTPTGAWTNSPATGNKTATLTVPATQDRNGNQYRCKVSNAAGSVTSNAATLTVQTVAKPVITSNPVSKTVGATDPVSFSVVATGEGLKYQWQYKTPTGVWANNTCTTATFSLTKAENFRNGYQYRCKVTNAGGTVYSNVATLTVASKPVIATQPKSITAKVGDTVTFTVSASGATSYQWQYKTPTGVWTNSPATGNKTATLTVPATQSRNGYQYRCIVSNAAGSVTSNAATLTVSASVPVAPVIKPTLDDVFYLTDYTAVTTDAWGAATKCAQLVSLLDGTVWLVKVQPDASEPIGELYTIKSVKNADYKKLVEFSGAASDGVFHYFKTTLTTDRIQKTDKSVQTGDGKVYLAEKTTILNITGNDATLTAKLIAAPFDVDLSGNTGLKVVYTVTSDGFKEVDMIIVVGKVTANPVAAQLFYVLPGDLGQVYDSETRKIYYKVAAIDLKTFEKVACLTEQLVSGFASATVNSRGIVHFTAFTPANVYEVAEGSAVSLYKSYLSAGPIEDYDITDTILLNPFNAKGTDGSKPITTVAQLVKAGKSFAMGVNRATATVDYIIITDT